MMVKKIVLIRHAQSVAQIASNEDRNTSPHLTDATLSRNGELELKMIHIPKGYVDIVYVSPLIRALQTALILFQDLSCPIIAMPELAEFATKAKMTGYENCGRSVKAIKEDLERMNLNPDSVDFSLVEKVDNQWWTKGYDKKKAKKQILDLKKKLWDTPNDSVALVGHCNNFMALTRTPFRIPNNQPVECKMKRSWTNGSVKIYQTKAPSLFLLILRRVLKIDNHKRAKVSPDPNMK